MQTLEINSLKNGKTFSSLHHQIVTLEVKNAELTKIIEQNKINT